MISDQIETDVWSAWLLHDRHGDDATYGGAMQSVVDRYANRVLDGARLEPGMHLLDVGTGDGLVAFRAIERTGPALQVILSDVSAPLLSHAEATAVSRGLERQCTFLQCSADDLGAVPDASVDVVTTRAVLAYVADKRAALSEFHRVLKPGGRISIAEPVFQDDALVACALRRLVEGAGAASPVRFLPLLHRWKAALFPDTEEKMAGDPLCNYSERDLLGFVQAAGFTRLHMEFHIDVEPVIVPTWAAFLKSALHPLAPTHGDILATQFDEEERQFFEQIVRPSIETGQFQGTDRIAYLTAIKTGG